jgi:hypothetical protein
MSDEEHNGIALTFGLLFFGGGLFFVVGSWGAYHRDTTLLSEGRRAQAQVVALEHIRDAGQDGSSDHLVRYRITLPDGGVVEKQAGLDKSSWQSLTVGGPIEVIYDPGQPRKGFPVGGGVTSRFIVWFATIFGAVFALGGLSLLVVLAKRFARRLRSTT